MTGLLAAIETFTLLFSLVSLVYAVGIVWRVEGELDTSYKFFAFSVVFFFISEFLSVFFAPGGEWFLFGEKMTRMLFAFLFLLGIWYMRDIVRKLDGEKAQEKVKEKVKNRI